MTNPEDNTRISDWKCERFLLGELDESEMERIRRQLEHDEDLRARLAELERSNHEILGRYPAGVMARQIEGKLASTRAAASRESGRQPRRGRQHVWVPVALAAVVATILLLNHGMVSELGFRGQDPIDPSTTRIKGPDAVLTLYRRTATGSERLENLDTAAEHDLILPHYRSDGPSYGLILSVDGRGVLTRHHPEHNGPALLEAGGPHALDFAYELDDAPLWEIFILASSKAEFAANAVIRAIEGSPLMQESGMSATDADSILQSLKLPRDVSLSTFTLIKEVGDEQ